MGVRINPTTQFQQAIHARKFKILNEPDVVRINPSVV